MKKIISIIVLLLMLLPYSVCFAQWQNGTNPNSGWYGNSGWLNGGWNGSGGGSTSYLLDNDGNQVLDNDGNPISLN